MPFIEQNKQPAYVGGDISYKTIKGIFTSAPLPYRQAFS